jgi:hypothetical protein
MTTAIKAITTAINVGVTSKPARETSRELTERELARVLGGRRAYEYDHHYGLQLVLQ